MVLDEAAHRCRYTHPPVRSTVEAVEANKVKLSVEIEADEFESEVNAAFKRLAKEVRLPGFRPGKAPRKVLEARLGVDVGRQEALREALPVYYSKAVIEHDVDVIAPPEIDIKSGQQTGAVNFDAVVEVRPQVMVAGYQSLRVEIPNPTPTDEEIDAQLDRLRNQYAHLESVDREIVEGDHVTIDIEGTYEDEPVPGLTTNDYLYEVGKGTVVPEIDLNLLGRKPGEQLSFEAAHPDPDEEGQLSFSINIKEVKEKVLPEVDDEFARNASEFDTAAELRDDIVNQLATQKRSFGQMAVRMRTTVELAKLIDDEVPEAMINAEMQSRIEDLVLRLREQGVTLEQYLSATGRTAAQIGEEAREAALEGVKTDLALRAVAAAEGIEVSEDDIDRELAPVAEQAKLPLETVRQRFTDSGQMSAVRSSIQKNKALDWLIERVEIVDPDGTVIDRTALETPDSASDQSDENTAETTSEPSDEEASQEANEDAQ
jgi:trigger factor